MRYPDETPRRRRRWPIFVPLILVLILGAGWAGFWFYAAGKAESVIAEWREREAKAGRVQTCGSQAIGGFPFRIEVRCNDFGFASAGAAALDLKLPTVLAALQVYDPTLLISEFSGPLTFSEHGRPPNTTVNWRLGQASVRGQLSAPTRIPIERTSIVLDAPTLAVAQDGTNVQARAERLELQGRPVPGSTDSKDPTIEAVLRLTAAVAPEIHPLVAEPVDAEITALLNSPPDVAPKPLPVLLREWQGRGGNMEITQARLQQGDIIATGTGVLKLTPRGGLDGQLQLTLVGVEKVLRKLGVDQIMAQGKVGSTINALDRLMPGLGAIARQNAAPGIMAGLGAIGQNTTLEGKPAVTLPLRFNDGAAFLGPIPLGRVQPLF
jgi:hypothetical protein